jgi:hypothetical protein
VIHELDCVALTEDQPEHQLKRGDVGAVVLIYGAAEAYEVEFVAPNGHTLALLTLPPSAVRHISSHEARKSRLRFALDRTSAELGPRITVLQLAARLGVDPEAEADSLLRGVRMLKLKTVCKAKLDGGRPQEKFPRVLIVGDPIGGNGYLVDLKAIKPPRRRRVIDAWKQQRRAAFQSLDSNFPAYQQKLRELLDTPG